MNVANFDAFDVFGDSVIILFSLTDPHVGCVSVVLYALTCTEQSH